MKWTVTSLMLFLILPLYGSVSWLEVTKAPAENWLGYSGDDSGQRFSTLSQIQTENVGRLVPQWVIHVPDATRLEATPVVVDGVMYLTNSNEVFALDAKTGRSLWHYQRAKSSTNAPNRGVAVLGDRLFFVSSDAHLVALHIKSGAVLWDVRYADATKHYSASLAPLVTRDKVIVGVSGGDCGIRGYVDAYDAETGKHAWRFWTVPFPGQPGAETWGGHPSDVAGGATWMTGTYDPVENVLYWSTGNPGPDFYGEERPGDNLYTDSVVALDADTGKRRWHFQFTPHDTHDWDAQQIPVLVDATFQGSPRKLLAQANRNGFFYLLDRTDGKMLLAKPFVKKLTWARGVLPDGRPDVIPGTNPTPEGKLVCPANVGATNWFSPSYSPQTHLFYVMAIEACDLYISSARTSGKGECNGGTGVDRPRSNTGQFVLRAIHLESGTIQWEIPLASGEDGYISSMPGTLATAGNLVFFGDDAGYLAAADARTGKLLWSFYTGQMITASPMTYGVGGRQYISMASGTDIFAFALFHAAEPPRQPAIEELNPEAFAPSKRQEHEMKTAKLFDATND
jgi:alcohol dehydrogenase (cytochrome c)